MEGSKGGVARWVVVNWGATARLAGGKWEVGSWANPGLGASLAREDSARWEQVNLEVDSLAKADLAVERVARLEMAESTDRVTTIPMGPTHPELL